MRKAATLGEVAGINIADCLRGEVLHQHKILSDAGHTFYCLVVARGLIANGPYVLTVVHKNDHLLKNK